MFFGPNSRAMACATARRPNFADGEGGKALAAAHAGGRAGEQDGAAAARHHDARRLAADQEAGVAGELPGLEEQLFGGLEQRLVDVRAGVEQADLDRSDLLFDAGEQVLNLGLLTGVDAERMDLLTGGLELVDQGLRLGGVAAANADRVAAFGETSRHRGADRIARADQYRDPAALRHPIPPNKF